MQARKQNVHERATRIELKDLSTDEQIRLEAAMREKAWRDEMDRLDGAMEKWISIGIDRGREQRDQEHVIKLICMQMASHLSR